jgi:hypothetical protein
MNARMESCQDEINMNIKTPTACTRERRNTFTFNVIWSPTRVVSLETMSLQKALGEYNCLYCTQRKIYLRRLVISPVFVVSKKPISLLKAGKRKQLFERCREIRV